MHVRAHAHTRIVHVDNIMLDLHVQLHDCTACITTRMYIHVCVSQVEYVGYVFYLYLMLGLFYVADIMYCCY